MRGLVDEAMIRTQIDDHRGRRETGGERRRGTVRQRGEHEIGACEGLGSGRREDQLGDRAQVRVQIADPLPGVALRGDCHDLEVRMRRDETQQLPTRVATGTGDGDPRTHVHEYAVRRNFIHSWGAYVDHVPRAESQLITAIRDGLRAAADASRAPQMQAYMKSAMPYLGVPMPGVRHIVRDAVQACPPTSATVLRTAVEGLWDGADFREERYAATALLVTPSGRRLIEASFVRLYERLIVSGAWWDHTDELAHRVGDLLRSDPDAVRPVVRAWQHSPDRWLRRASVICQLGFRESTDRTLLAEAIEATADDPDFFLRKAIGWALRDLARTDPQWVRGFLAAHPQLARLSVREASKHL